MCNSIGYIVQKIMLASALLTPSDYCPNNADDHRLCLDTLQVRDHVIRFYTGRGMETYTFWSDDDTGLVKLKGMETGAGIPFGDVELFVRLAQIFRPSSIYGVGNAFGFSTLVLSNVFSGALLDIIDAGLGADGLAGIHLTNEIAAANGLDIHVHHGISPRDVRASQRKRTYELAFIDGNHYPRHLKGDFHAILPNMTHRCLIICHDVGFYDGLAQLVHNYLIPRNTDFNYVQPHGTNFKNVMGTGIFYRGLSDAEAEYIRSLGTHCPFLDWPEDQRCRHPAASHPIANL